MCRSLSPSLHPEIPHNCFKLYPLRVNNGLCTLSRQPSGYVGPRSHWLHVETYAVYSERALSPPPPISSPRIRSPPPHSQRPNASSRPISDVRPLSAPDDFADPTPGDRRPPPPSNYEQRGQSLEAFQTSLPIRLDYEAMLAYLLLPPAGGVFLLLVEHKSDYVRFHAWQGSMLFSILFVLHLCFSPSRILSWMLFVVDLVLMAFLASRAYRDVDTLEHFELPILGRLANRWVDDE